MNNFAISGLYERACEWKLSPAQSVTALACVNSVLSPIALCATSDRWHYDLQSLSENVEEMGFYEIFYIWWVTHQISENFDIYPYDLFFNVMETLQSDANVNSSFIS